MGPRGIKICVPWLSASNARTQWSRKGAWLIEKKERVQWRSMARDQADKKYIEEASKSESTTSKECIQICIK